MALVFGRVRRCRQKKSFWPDKRVRPRFGSASAPAKTPGLSAAQARRQGEADGGSRMTEERDIVSVFPDGACRGNPGPGGWGVLISHNGVDKELFGSETQTTNNRMELLAAIHGLGATEPGATVSVYTDSQYVRNGVTQWMANWKKNGWKTAARKPVKNQDLWQRLDEVVGARAVEWYWVRGHSGHPGNERADALANHAIDQLLKG